ncbi:M23 family metallopeptidase [Thiovibrio sp. JS02]
MELEPLEKKREIPQSKAAFFVLAGFVVLLAALGGLCWVGFERELPQVHLAGDVSRLGLAKQVSLAVSDAKSGLRSVRVSLMQGEKNVTVFEKSFPRQGYLSGAGPLKLEEAFEVAGKNLGFKDGEATLLVTVRDYSFSGWFNGNETALAQPVVFDTRPPAVGVADSPQYIDAGSAGVVVYRVNEPVDKHGVVVNDLFFPGFPLPKKGEGVYAACIGLPFDTVQLTKVMVTVTDLAGNENKAPFSMRLRQRKITTDQIAVSDGFLSAKLPEFIVHYPDLAGTPIEQYLRINNEIRRQNNAKISEICAKSQPERLWEGRFDRWPGSTRARYADRRTYLYEGRAVDEQVHLGMDLASLQHAPVQAANRGVVVFADYLGIYGNMVILDHGQGIFSLYSHLSQIDATVGSMMERGGQLGLSGMSGMAGGDHLHFSILVNGVFVDPIAWWDENWVQLHMQSYL